MTDSNEHLLKDSPSHQLPEPPMRALEHIVAVVEQAGRRYPALAQDAEQVYRWMAECRKAMK